ncbi:MAG TPA: hypothetical protein VKD90_18040 [Gemmataceae bacterium]|nr:hypothetical protein [Gemmataceae bacterium]
MAKPLVFEFRGGQVSFGIQKVDRTKLYGYVDSEVVDEAGRACELGTLLGDGHSVVGKGGTGLAYLSPDGLWRKKADLRPVDRDGKPIPTVKSTFDTVVPLSDQATIEYYLSHNIHLIYLLTHEPAEGMAPQPIEELTEDLREGTIYRFPFSYRGGVAATVGFLLAGGDGNLFLCVGVPTAIEYVGLKATAAVVADPGDEAAEEDALDFSLV